MTREKDVKILFDFLTEPLGTAASRAADIMIVFGNHRASVGRRAAALMKQGRAPVAILSGGISRSGKVPSKFGTEAQLMRSVMQHKGIEAWRLITEERATNIWENVVYSREVMRSRGIRAGLIIGVCYTPYVRRAQATVEREFAGIRVEVAAPQMNIDRFRDKAGREVLVMEIERLIELGERGDVTASAIPDVVLEAVDRLKSAPA